LVLPPGHEVLEDDGEDVWSVVTGSAFLFFVEYLPEPVLQRMRTLAPAYRLSSPADDEPHWVNHCETCGRAFDDDELFGEPGGGFVPTSEAEARLIELVSVDQALEAGAGGYAYEPQFFDSMRRA
jgi:hypothetical protein